MFDKSSIESALEILVLNKRATSDALTHSLPAATLVYET